MLNGPSTKLDAREIHFNIAGINFDLQSELPDHINWCRQHYHAFLGFGDEKRKIRITVKDQRKNININRLSFPDCSSLFQIHYGRLLAAEGDLSAGQIRVEVKDGFGLGDFLKSLVSAVLIENEGFLLHASGVAAGDKGYVFSGPSGSGKTTIARLSQPREILNDESVAFRKLQGRWYAYATPFFGELGRQDKNIYTPLTGVFFLHQDHAYSHHPLSRRDALKRIFSNVILRDRRSASVDTLFDIVSEALDSIPCYDLHFKPYRSLWRYIDAIN